MINIVVYDSRDFKSLFQSLDLIQCPKNENEKKIQGPIQIAKNILVSKIDYSDNFEVLFEFKASSMPIGGWQQILIGNLIKLC